MGIKETGAVIGLVSVCLIGTFFVCSGACKAFEKLGFEFS